MTQVQAHLQEQLRKLSHSTIDHWNVAPNAKSAPLKVRHAMANLATHLDAPDSSLLRAVERLVKSASSSVARKTVWTTESLRILILALNSYARQLRRSPLSKEILQLCTDVRENIPIRFHLDKNQLVRIQAALMVIEDAICAVEGYSSSQSFSHVDEAYLAKYGLLQALQLGFDATEALGKVVGLKLRADSSKGGKSVKIARNKVAGHPLKALIDSKPWDHFHDRSTAHEKSIIRVMSFAATDSTNWTGESLSTVQLIEDGLTTIRDKVLEIVEYLASVEGDDSPDKSTN